MDTKKLRPDRAIPGTADLTIGDFWSWAYSDIMSNTRRGEFAEFLVASALGVIDSPRIGWDSVDVRYKDRGIEVKCSAYLQTWHQNALSPIKFGFGKTRAWDPQTNVLAAEPNRSADCYVFCLYPEKEAALADILNVPAWQFYAVPTAQINQMLGDQKSLTLKRLESLGGPVQYLSLKARIDQVLGLGTG
jgi:hypothetical protein